VVTFAPFDIPFDHPQLTRAEQADGGAFEWWYFDCQTDDGIQMVILFSLRNPLFAARKPSIYIEYTDNARSFRHVANFPAASFSWEESPGVATMRIGEGNVLRLVGATTSDLTYELTLALPWLSATLQARPLHRGFVPGNRGCYFSDRNDASRRTCVSFSAPVMSVNGEIVFKGEQVKVSGRGYHDHPWGTAQLFFTHQEWNWGRVSNETTSVMFADVKPAGAFEGTLRFMYQGTAGTFEPVVSEDLQIHASEWKRDSWHGIRFPHVLNVASAGKSSIATLGACMLDTPVYNRAAATWTPGQGWIEYFRMPSWLRQLAFIGGRLLMFFWRPFPFFGR
jgi:hypothetical protein